MYVFSKIFAAFDESLSPAPPPPPENPSHPTKIGTDRGGGAGVVRSLTRAAQSALNCQTVKT